MILAAGTDAVLSMAAIGTNNRFVEVLVLVLVLVFVLVLTYFTTRWIGNYQKKHASYGNVRIIESCRLSNSKVLEIVKAGDKCFLIAVCKDTVTLLGEVNEDTMDFTEKSGVFSKGSNSKSGSNENFASVFSRFRVAHGDEDDSQAARNNAENGADDNDEEQ